MGIQERREREREARRRAVLDAARQLVRERGFAGTTTKEIARRCELSEATLFGYFQNKDEILTSLVLEGIDFATAGYEEILDSDADPAHKLARLWQFFSKVRAEHPEHFHVFAYMAQPQGMASVASEVKAEIARRSGENFRRITALLREVTGEEDVRLRADLLWAAFVGLSVLRDARLNLGLGTRTHLNEEHMRRALQILLGGITSPSKGSGRRST
jgi:AcrR family transcriptional regulator